MPNRTPSHADAKRSAATGALYFAGGQLSKVALQFAGVVILSRLLDPAAFGIFAQALLVVTAGEVFRDGGLTSAALQAERLPRGLKSNLFWINLSLGFILGGVAFGIAPVVARAFGTPDLEHVVQALSVVFVIAGIQNQSQVQLLRDFRFGVLAATEISGNAIGLIAGVLAALSGLGYWSLVVQSLTATLVLASSRIFLAGWIPGLPRRGVGTKSLTIMGLHLGLAQGLTVAANSADTAVISYNAPASTVGSYNRAFQFTMTPVSQLLSPLTNVVLPTLSRLRNDRDSFDDYLSTARLAIVVPSAWLMALLAALSVPVVDLLLGSEWASTAKYLSILAVASLFTQLNISGYWAFLSLGLAKDYLKFNAIAQAATVLAMVWSGQWGADGVAWALVGSRAVGWGGMLLWLRRRAGLPMRRDFAVGLASLAVGAATGLVAYLTFTWSSSSGVSDFPAMVLAASVGTVVYYSVQLLNPEFRALGHRLFVGATTRFAR